MSITDDRTYILGKGGRYDKLLSLYHPQGQNFPGIGFALNIDELQQALQTHPAMPQVTATSDWLVVATEPRSIAAALTHAQELRSSPEPVRVEMYLNDGTPAEISQIAIDRGIRQIAWVSPVGVTVEALK